MALYKSVSELIGETPLLEIMNFDLPAGVQLFAKLEYFNPGGSVKDRLGVELINEALDKGYVKEGGTIIEPTAGNTGIGIAIAAREKNLSVIFCVPEHFSKEKQQLMQALGAKIVHTPQKTGMKGAIDKTAALLREIPNSFSPKQFSNPANPMTYYKSIAPEIWRDLKGKIDVFIAGAGTGGAFMGIAKYLKEKNPAIKTVIVEPDGSIIGGGKPGPHRTEGIGMEFIPDFLDRSYIDKIQTISDEHAFQMVRELASREGVLAGSSSGAVMYAALLEAGTLTNGGSIVTIFPDGSDRYLSKNIYEVTEM
ncbi:cysteine synthase family protein [Oceanobacillus massiliensis]|uniref:PLP-dependent cysteine synthase family protein n=1 Tax=Oceanobacillus massiliensis TaxID=1465765 RepID=UPI003018C3E7